jgi:hypothetical protein
MYSTYENTQKYFDHYERQFMEALLAHPLRKPWQSEDRETIISETKKVLNIQDNYIPKIRERYEYEIKFDGYNVKRIFFESWDNFYGMANLYSPESGGKGPMIIFCCGHGNNGRLTPSYQALARRLVRQGAYVLVSDNIGQGEREPLGHRTPVAPFYCGLSVQGLIVMETLAWINRVKEYPFVDKTRIGACGNSGGGLLTLFLSALSPDLAAINSSGYPTAFWWIGAKEKRHCHCNIIPNVLTRVEMWELFSVFAPRPLFLFQGLNDHMLPYDLFYKNARNVQTTYKMLNAEDQFSFSVLPGLHPVDNERRISIGGFFKDVFGMEPPEEIEDDLLDIIDPLSKTCEFPGDAINIDELAQKITGIKMPEDTHLYDVYKPKYQGNIIKEGDIEKDSERGKTMQILAQFEAYL